MLARAASHLGAALFYKIFYKFFCKNLLTFANSFAIITHVVRSKHPDDASCGGLAQLGERLHGMQEVTGSIPVFSTISRLIEFLSGGFSFYFTRQTKNPSALSQAA